MEVITHEKESYRTYTNKIRFYKITSKSFIRKQFTINNSYLSKSKTFKLLDDVVICCDDKKILNIANKYRAKAILTSPNHKNGTERICEAYQKLNKKI